MNDMPYFFFSGPAEATIIDSKELLGILFSSGWDHMGWIGRTPNVSKMVPGKALILCPEMNSLWGP